MNRHIVALMAVLFWAGGLAASEREILPMNNALLSSLGEAQKKLNAGDLDTAIDIAKGIEVDGLNGTEKGQLGNFIGIALFQRGDRSDAIEHFEDVIDQARHLPASIEYNARFNLAQLFFLKKQYDRAIAAMDGLRATDAPGTPQQIYFPGQVHYQAENYAAAADTIAEAISAANEAGANVPDAWTTLQRHAALRR